MKMIIFFILLSISASGYSQASVTATVSVTILKPLGITKEADLNFAEVTVGETNGTVVLSPESARTVSGGASFPSHSTQAAQAATFKITGEEAIYDIILPEEVLLSDGSRTLKVDNFTHNSTGNIENGAETVYVGATLHVHGKQEPGTYQNTSNFRVTVQYK